MTPPKKSVTSRRLALT